MEEKQGVHSIKKVVFLGENKANSLMYQKGRRAILSEWLNYLNELLQEIKSHNSITLTEEDLNDKIESLNKRIKG